MSRNQDTLINILLKQHDDNCFLHCVLFLHSVFMLHYISVCSVPPLSCLTPCCLFITVPLSLCFVSPHSACVSRSFLRLQDYRAEGQSRCALDYEAEISLQSSCPAQFIKGGGGGGGGWVCGGLH